jgi:hypothetical protein
MPAFTGSATDEKTIGMVLLIFADACAQGVLMACIKSTLSSSNFLAMTPQFA